MRLVSADSAHYVHGNVLHFFSNGVEAAELSLAPVIDGLPLEVNSWEPTAGGLIGRIRGGGAIHLTAQGGHLVYWVQKKFDAIRSAVLFPSSNLLATEYHAFVSDWADRSFGISEDNEIVASTAVSPPAQGRERPRQQSWMMAPSPRDVAFRSDGPWWGICIPGSLPVGETRFAVRRGRLSIELRNYIAANANGTLPRVVLAADLPSPYDILDVDVQFCRERREIAAHRRFCPWWSRPIFCTWGEQVQTADAHAALTAANVRRWTAIVREKTGLPDFTVIIDAPWFDKHGDFIASAGRFGSTEGLRALIDELHRAGHRVLLWFTPFKIDFDSDIATTEPDCLLLDHAGRPLRCDERSGFRDFTSAVGRNTLINNLRYCLSPDADCLDADGLKIDFNYHNPDLASARLRNPRWGAGDEHWTNVLRHLHEDAHRIKPDCLITTSGVAPYLAGHTDMLRLNDLFDEDPTLWFKRARLGTRLMPGTPIDADGWPMTHARCNASWMVSPVYGVPDLYHATLFDGREKLDEADYRRLSAAWHVYLNAPLAPDMQIAIEPETGTFQRRYGSGPLKGQLAAVCFERACLATFSPQCARIAAVRDIHVALPLPHPQRVARLDAVRHDGRREPIDLPGAGPELKLRVPDAASDVKYIEAAF